MKLLHKILLLSCVLLAFSLSAEELPATTVVVPIWIHDGDTFRATVLDRAVVDCRIFGIDAPELNQPWGKVARSALLELVHRKKTVVVTKNRSFGRLVVTVSAGEKDVALELLKMGLAWYTPQYTKIPEYAAAEAEAKAARRGLWSDKEPIAPWTWRRRK